MGAVRFHDKKSSCSITDEYKQRDVWKKPATEILPAILFGLTKESVGFLRELRKNTRNHMAFNQLAWLIEMIVDDRIWLYPHAVVNGCQ